MKIKTQISITIVALVLLTSSCRKNKESETSPSTETGEVLNDFAYKVAFATYIDLESKALSLHSKIMLFNSSNSASDLESCKQLWKDTRAAWEQNEAFLFGPVATEDIDPGIDDWPVNKADLDSLLSSNQAFTQGFLDSTQTTLKGFHPMEYLLFGTTGNKLATDFTQREKAYLVSLADYIKRLTIKVRKSWDPNETGNYLTHIVNAGKSGSLYGSKLAAFEEIINAMIGICEEVADGKIQEPLVAQNPSLGRITI